MRKLALIMMILQCSVLVNGQQVKSFYDYVVKDIHGKDFHFDQLKGKKVLIVNTASRCGYTPQYEGLEKLYREYGPDHFVIIGFPSNDFWRREPGNNEKILEFCQRKYDVTFPLMAKTSVKGKRMHPVYKWLTRKKLNGVMDSEVRWNFQKYMIDEEGKLVGSVLPKEKPYSYEIINWLTEW